MNKITTTLVTFSLVFMSIKADESIATSLVAATEPIIIHQEIKHEPDRFFGQDIYIGNDFYINKERYQITGFEKQAFPEYQEFTLYLEKPYTILGFEFYRTTLTLSTKKEFDANNNEVIASTLTNKKRSFALKTYIIAGLCAYSFFDNIMQPKTYIYR